MFEHFESQVESQLESDRISRSDLSDIVWVFKLLKSWRDDTRKGKSRTGLE